MDKALPGHDNASDHQGCHTELKTGGDAVTVRQGRGRAEVACPRNARSELSSYPRRLERIQREYELSHALTAARTLQARLELAGLNDLAATAHGIRDVLAGELQELGR